MYEYFFAVISSDKAITLSSIKPLNLTCHKSPLLAKKSYMQFNLKIIYN